MSCPICIEDFDNKTRKKVVCPACSYESCQSCTQQFLESETLHYAICMNCRKSWNYDFLVRMTNPKWLSGAYRKHIEDILYQRERARLTEHSDFVANYKLKERILNEGYLNKIDLQFTQSGPKELWKALYDSIDKNPEMQHSYFLDTFRDLMVNDRTNAFRSAAQVFSRFESLNPGFVRPRARAHVEHTPAGFERVSGPPPVRVYPCPTTGCFGSLNESNFSCDLCSKQYCRRCHEEASGTHECKKQDIESVEEIEKNTTQCPQCHTRIFRTEGCNQMWCTICKVFFDYRTSKKIGGPGVTNPHFREWMAKNKISTLRTDETVITDDVMVRVFDSCNNARTFPLNPVAHLNLLLYVPKPGTEREHNDRLRYLMDLFETMRNILVPSETLGQLIQKLESDIEASENPKDLRINLMTGKLSEDQFKGRISAEYRKSMYRREILEVWVMIRCSLMDLADSFMTINRYTGSNPGMYNEVVDWIKKVETMRFLANDAWLNISKLYKVSVSHFNSNWYHEMVKNDS